ncbi:MAG: hypothetical protein ABMA13_20795 [Chthoniobacteraceae bacterium]
MKLDRSHTPWAIIIGVITLICAALYFGASSASGRIPLLRVPLPEWLLDSSSPRNTVGAKPLGLFFGIAAFAIFLFASALGVRKKRRLWRVGSVQLWLKAHVWLTILTIPLVLFHCGFRLGGMHTSVLFWLYAIVMVSGFFGMAMQHFLPHLMMERLPREWVYEQIPNVRATNFERALEFTRELDGKLKDQPAPVGGGTATITSADASPRIMLELLRGDAMPYLADSSATKTRLAERRTSDEVFKLLRVNVSDSYRPQVDEIKTWCDDHRLMAYQEKLHHWLHAWLAIHVPISFALLIWTVWHIFITFTYLN